MPQSPCLSSPPLHRGNDSEPSSDVAHCDSVKAMFGTVLGSELWNRARTAVPWHRHRRRSPGAAVVVTGSVGFLRRRLCLLIPYNHHLCTTPSLMEIQNLPSGVFRPQLCHPMIPGDLLLQGQQDPEAPCPVHPFLLFYVHSRAWEHSSIY